METSNDSSSQGISLDPNQFSALNKYLKEQLSFGVQPSAFSEGELADHIVMLRDLKSLLEAREKLLNSALQSRYSTDLEIIKQAYDDNGEKRLCAIIGVMTPGVSYEYVVQHRLDGEVVKEEMGEDWWEDHTKAVSFFQARKLK